MRATIIAAIIFLSIGAARTPALMHHPACALNLQLSHALCVRLSSAPVHARAGGWVHASAAATLVYASEPVNAAVEIESVTARGFTSSGSLTIAGGLPFGMSVDANQNLYVAVATLESGTPSVQVFPRGSTQPSQTFTSGLTGPIDVAVDRHGTLYVANLRDPLGGGCGAGSGPGGNVLEYAKGSTTPTRTIDSFPGCPTAVAVDDKSNLYLTYVYYPATGLVQSDVIEYADKSTRGKSLGLNAPGGPEFGGIALDANGDLLVQNVQDDATLNQILTYPHGSTTPSNTIQYGGTAWGTSFKFFAPLGNRYFAPAYMSENYSEVADTLAAFDYPSGRQLFVQKLSASPPAFVYGMAVSAAK